MDRKEFLNIIYTFRRRLDAAGFLKRLVFALAVGGGAGILLQAVSFMTAVYYVNVYSAVAVILAVVSAAVVSLLKRSSMEHTALVMDGYGFKERIVTAYEHLEKEDTIYVLQRRDAMEQLKMHRDKIRIPLMPDWKKTALSVLLLAIMIGLAFVPSPVRDQARELHHIRQEAREKEEEIQEVLEELDKLEKQGQEVLTPEQLAAMQEMMESLKSSMSEYQQVSSADALQAAGEKLNYKYENMSGLLSNLAQTVQSDASVSAMSAESMQAMADKLQEMSGNTSAGQNDLASGQGQNGQNGQGQDGQGNSQNGKGNGQGNGNSGQNGQGSGSGGQNSQGQDGQGNGPSGNTNGDDNGPGRGTGTANNAHDYVSIPNDIADSGNLTGNAVDHYNSEYYRAQNGLSWEGEHVSYDAVIGNYEQNAYEGIAAGRYPSGMENVIKEYFAGFN